MWLQTTATQGLTFPSYETHLCTFISHFYSVIYRYMTPQTHKERRRISILCVGIRSHGSNAL